MFCDKDSVYKGNAPNGQLYKSGKGGVDRRKSSKIMRKIVTSRPVVCIFSFHIWTFAK